MAEINASQESQKGGKIRSKKSSTKIDMTPMVDLAFLLITFFMLATTLTKPQAMQLNMPDNTGETNPIGNTRSITVILGEKNKLYFIRDIVNPQVTETNYSTSGIRKLLNDGNAAYPGKFTVLIKPMAKSNYKNMVDVLDEMEITNSRFSVVEPTAQDIQLVAQKKG